MVPHSLGASFSCVVYLPDRKQEGQPAVHPSQVGSLSASLCPACIDHWMELAMRSSGGVAFCSGYQCNQTEMEILRKKGTWRSHQPSLWKALMEYCLSGLGVIPRLTSSLPTFRWPLGSVLLYMLELKCSCQSFLYPSWLLTAQVYLMGLQEQRELLESSTFVSSIEPPY